MDGLRKMRSKIVEIEASLGENLIETVFSLQMVKFNCEKNCRIVLYIKWEGENCKKTNEILEFCFVFENNLLSPFLDQPTWINHKYRWRDIFTF